MSIAFFDMDGTIVGGDTNDISIGEFVKRGIARPNIIKSLEDYERQFYEGTLNVRDFLKFAVKPLVGMDKETLYKVLHDIVKTSIMPVVYPGAKRAIKFHNDRNDTVVIVTSTMDYLAEHIAEQLNIRYVIASPMEKKDGVLTGEISGIPAFQKDKVTRINMFLKEHELTLDDSYAYGDTVNDVPMLMMCTHRYAVNPNRILLESESIKEMTVVDWKK